MGLYRGLKVFGLAFWGFELLLMFRLLRVGV